MDLSVTFLASQTFCYLSQSQANCDITLSHLFGTWITTISDNAQGMGVFYLLLLTKSAAYAGEATGFHGLP